MGDRTFAVTWDYRCPFARNAHEHVVAGLEAGAGWEVDFAPFSLSQVHTDEDDPPVWEDSTKRRDLIAMLVGIVVRDRHPEAFLRTHLALFTVRHDESRDLRDEGELRKVLADNGVDEHAVFAEVEDGWPLRTLQESHEALVHDHDVFGVPTFILGDRAAFVRLMTRPAGDGARAISTVDHVIGLLEGHPELNEFKHTTIPR